MDHKPNFKDGKAGAAISIRVTTRSPRTEFAGIMDDGTIKVKLTSPPIDGKANEELVKFLASVMRIPKTNVEIISGQASKNKLVVLFGIDSDRVNQLISNEIKN